MNFYVTPEFLMKLATSSNTLLQALGDTDVLTFPMETREFLHKYGIVLHFLSTTLFQMNEDTTVQDFLDFIAKNNIPTSAHFYTTSSYEEPNELTFNVLVEKPLNKLVDELKQALKKEQEAKEEQQQKAEKTLLKQKEKVMKKWQQLVNNAGIDAFLADNPELQKAIETVRKGLKNVK
jgi:hypothetical protein